MYVRCPIVGITALLNDTVYLRAIPSRKRNTDDIVEHISEVPIIPIMFGRFSLAYWFMCIFSFAVHLF